MVGNEKKSKGIIEKACPNTHYQQISNFALWKKI